MITQRTYPAKLLLFGEYTVLTGSRALAIPLHIWGAKWRQDNERPREGLLDFADFLGRSRLFSASATEAFKSAVTNGYLLESDIPQGFGVGSSGALCAAVFDAFDDREPHPLSLSAIRETLAGMESFFHGKSSGMDPLVSLNNAPVLHEFDKYHALRRTLGFSPLIPFLIDSGIARKTDHLVQIYLQKSRQEDFQLNCIRPLVQSVDHAIAFSIDFHLPLLLEHLQLISQLQFQYFPEMIPEVIHRLWRDALDRDDVIIKLCGAGGGGFFLGFASSSDALHNFTARCTLNVIPLDPG